MRPAQRRHFRLLLLLPAALLAVTACSSSGDSSDDKAGSAAFEEAGGRAPEAPADRDGLNRSADGVADDLSDPLAFAETADRPERESTDAKIIAKGNVSLESDDVADAAIDVQKIVDHYFGEITQRQTSTNDDGDVSDVRLLLRIPVADFDNAFTDLQGVGDLQDANTGKEDVTTRVIDTQVRIRAQRRSLARVEQLFDRAASISDIIRIESQVSRRQADLESLEQRLNYLTNQTSMSTISVNISLPPPEKAKEKKKDEPEKAGFFAGLEDGWHALKSFSTDVATVSGKVLPFAAVLLVIGGPLWLLVRRFRNRGGGPARAAPPAG
jgi:hypothetical protein